ncbi:hypothetical protein BC829DRAFT_424157 [Chytridium lagenaria]|nr:hypothetical protein BC829DRAFT_424157 [Chytridium lagenaria]
MLGHWYQPRWVGSLYHGKTSVYILTLSSALLRSRPCYSLAGRPYGSVTPSRRKSFYQDLTIRLRDLFPYGLVTPPRRKIRLFIKTLLMLPFAIFRSRPNYSFARFIPVWFGHSITAKNRLSRPNYSLARLPFGLVIPSRRNIGWYVFFFVSFGAIPIWFGHSVMMNHRLINIVLFVCAIPVWFGNSVRTKHRLLRHCAVLVCHLVRYTTNAFLNLKNIKPSIRHSQYRKIKPALFVHIIAHSAWSIRHDEASVIWFQLFLVYYVELSYLLTLSSTF